MEGNVEVCIDGFWGTVCSNSWDSREASVVCKQLGYLNSGMNNIIYDIFMFITMEYLQLQFHFGMAILVLEVDPFCLITSSALEVKAISLTVAIAVLE